MPIRFQPKGNLDLLTDPMSLSDSLEGKVVSSGDMQRCTNLDVFSPGVASTRKGSSILATLSAAVNHLQWMSGYRYEFLPTGIYRNGSLVEGSYTAGDDWTSVVYNPYNVTTLNIYCTNGTLLKRIEGATAYTWGIDAPTAAPGLTVVTPSGSDFHRVVYTYCRKDGTTLEAESNPSPEGTTSASTIPITATWTASSDSQVTHVRFYRSLANGTTLYYCDEFAVGLGTGSLDAADDDLGSSPEYDHDPPPAGISKLTGPNYEGTLFAVVDNKLYWSKPKQPEYWPTDYWVEVSGPDYPLLAVTIFGGQIYAASEIDLYQIQGTSATTFFSYALGVGSGTKAGQCFLGDKAFGLVHLNFDGLYQFTGGRDVESLIRFRPTFNGETVGSTPGLNTTYRSNCWAIYYQGRLYFGYPDSTETYPGNILVTDVESKKTVHYSYPCELVHVFIDPDNGNLLACDSAGYIITLEDSTVTEDSSTAISWDMQTKDFGSLRKYFPRWTKYDIGISGSGSADVTVILDGSVIQTHSIASSRSTKKRLIATSAGDRLSMRVNGSGPVDIYSMEIE